MIISINLDLFNHENDEILNKINKIIDFIFEKELIWDSDNISDLFEENNFFINSRFYDIFLSKYQKTTINENISVIKEKRAYQTSLHNHYLKKISIGLGNKDVHPNIAYEIISKPSAILVENGENDFKFIRGIVNKYKNHKSRKTLYRYIEKQLELKNLLSENAGGRDSILSRFRTLCKESYEHIEKYKIFILFDSDKNNTDKIVNNEQKKIIGKLKRKEIKDIADCEFENTDVCTWHMLYKRNIENYLPLPVLKKNFNLSNEITIKLDNFTNNQRDYVNYSDLLKDCKIDIKNDFPKLFLDQSWTKEQLEHHCEHHFVSHELPNGTQESISEIEIILLKILRIL